MAKPAAPALLRAFFLAFKKVNEKALLELKEELLVAVEAYGETAALMVEELFDPRKDNLCGDLAIQHHCGTAVGSGDLAWHYDAFNSAFHVSVTFHGTRKLLSRVGKEPPIIDSECEPLVHDLSPGKVYISNPSNFCHAIAFPECEWTEPSVAVQCRLLYTADQYKLFTENIPRQCWQQVHEIVSAKIQQGFVLPTMGDVTEVRKDLE